MTTGRRYKNKMFWVAGCARNPKQQKRLRRTLLFSVSQPKEAQTF